MFETDRFIEDCHAALREADARGAVQEIVARAAAHPAQVVRALGEPVRGEIQTIYTGADMTILNLLWGPRLFAGPHDHRMWAVIGIYGGEEHNVFYRRTADGLARQGEKKLVTGDVTALGENAIHAVRNPLDKITAAIHVYGGDFFQTPRSEWDEETFEERPYDVQRVKRLFEESNALLQEMAPGPPTTDAAVRTV